MRFFFPTILHDFVEPEEDKKSICSETSEVDSLDEETDECLRNAFEGLQRSENGDVDDQWYAFNEVYRFLCHAKFLDADIQDTVTFIKEKGISLSRMARMDDNERLDLLNLLHFGN